MCAYGGVLVLYSGTTVQLVNAVLMAGLGSSTLTAVGDGVAGSNEHELVVLHGVLLLVTVVLMSGMIVWTFV